MAQIEGSIRVTGFIAPTDSEDTYAVTDEKYNRGGYRSVLNEAERLAITDGRRKKGMLVYQESDDTFWMLKNGITNAHWQLGSFGGGGSSEIIERGENHSHELDGIKMSFNSLYPFKPLSVIVFFNGIRLVRDDDYEENINCTGINLFLETPPENDDKLIFDYIRA